MFSHNSGGHVDDDHDSTTNLTTNNHHHHHHNHNLIRVSTISSSSSSNTSSNHSPFFKNTKTMEEVWKDINLTATTKGYRGFILQDFLAKPFSSTSTHTHDTPTNNNVSSSSPPAPVPPMMLNLNSGPDQLNFLGEDHTRNVVVCPPFDQVLASSTNSSSGLLGHHDGLRMLPDTDRTGGGGGGDRRHKRMIKNRESAARSRARKQAYTNELENEVERLKEENAMLKRQQKLQVASAAQMAKKGGLQRTSTAPF